MPRVFNRLWMAHFCGWMGLMSLIIYYTEFFGEVIYNGDPMAEKGTIQRTAYEEGLRMGSLGLFLQNTVGIFTAFFADDIILKLGKRNSFILASVSRRYGRDILLIAFFAFRCRLRLQRGSSLYHDRLYWC